MHVIATAGHIDHGKSTLIRTLTGIDPDRLQEEKARGMTIDLGFAWITLPSGRTAGIVDVPGHQRFVKNMLAGVSGVDGVLFVVAATESWMPQSQEHLDILELLGVRRGIVVLTKADLVDDEWLEMVRDDVQQRLAGSCLEGAPMVAVSTVTGQGLDELLRHMDEMLASAPAPRDIGRPRLWIDRVFTIRGAGTVVTGTLVEGPLVVDQEVEILPRGLRARVRGIQTHRQQVSRAEPGSRVALNLSGVEREQMDRGDVVALSGFLRPSSRLRACVRLLPHAARELPRATQVMLHIGTAERMAGVRLLEKSQLEPGQEGLVDLLLDQPVAVSIKDLFVIREPGLHATLGGGSVLDPHPPPLPRRRRGSRTGVSPEGDPAAERTKARRGRWVHAGPAWPLPAALEPLAPVSRRERLLALAWERARCPRDRLPELALQERWVLAVDQLRREMPLAEEELDRLLDQAVQEGRVFRLPSYWWDGEGWRQWTRLVLSSLQEFHQRYPLRAGEDRETLRSRLGAESRLFEESVQQWVKQGLLRSVGTQLALAEHRVTYSPQEQEAIQRLWQILEDAGFEPPSLDELTGRHGFSAELLNALLAQGQLVSVGKGLVYRPQILEQIKEVVVAGIKSRGEVDVAWLRDQLATSRKYAIPLMEYFDHVGLTRRIGDKRVLAAGQG